MKGWWEETFLEQNNIILIKVVHFRLFFFFLEEIEKEKVNNMKGRWKERHF